MVWFSSYGCRGFFCIFVKNKGMTTAQTTKINKKRLIDAMVTARGVITTACTAVGIDRSTYYRYYKTDEEFKTAVDDIENVAVDFAESKLFELIDDKNVAAICFYLKCKGKKRGYVERQEIDHSGKVDTGGIIVKAATKEDIETVQKFLGNG